MTYQTVDEIFGAIDKTRSKIIKIVAELSDEKANFKFSSEKWSIANIVEHLAKTEESLTRLVNKLLAQAEAENTPSNGEINPPFSFAEISEKWRGQKLEAPAAIRPDGVASIAESLTKLEKSRAALHELRPRLTAVDLSNAIYPHPFFGPMNLYYWLAFIGLHELHHLKQISETLAAREGQMQNN